MSRAKRRLVIAALTVGAVLLVGFAGFSRLLAPMPSGPEQMIRFRRSSSLRVALAGLEGRGVVRSARALWLYARLRRSAGPVAVGTYRVRPGMAAGDVLEALRAPIRQFVQLPAHFWIARTARLLESKGVCRAADYVAWAGQPQAFQRQVKFPLPKKGTLEGYLYPDTYDLPPLLGAKETIERQLQAFSQKVGPFVGSRKDIHRILTIASMVQLEVARDEERPVVAGVIENRLKKGMRLQIDATSLYSMKLWKEPTRKDLVRVDSPYNTYLHAGLPPGPVCSPSVKSIRAALRPTKHSYLFYVALPDGRSLFAATLTEHAANIQRRKRALKS